MSFVFCYPGFSIRRNDLISVEVYSGWWFFALPLWQMMEFVNGKDDNPYMKRKNESHVPNHQPVLYIHGIYIYIHMTRVCIYILHAIYVYVCVYVCVCVYMCLCICMRMCICIQRYIYIYVCVMLYMQCANTQTLTTLSTATAPYTISPISSWTLPSWKTWYPGKTWSPGRISVERAIIRIGIYKLYPNLWGFWSNHPQQPEAISSIALQHPLAIQEPPSTTGLNHHWNRRESFFPS